MPKRKKEDGAGWLFIRDGEPLKRWSPEQLAEIERPQADGAVRFHERTSGGIERTADGWRRYPPGWYVEVCQDGEWRYESGPIYGSLTGVPVRQLLDAAETAGLLCQ